MTAVPTSFNNITGIAATALIVVVAVASCGSPNVEVRERSSTDTRAASPPTTLVTPTSTQRVRERPAVAPLSAEHSVSEVIDDVDKQAADPVSIRIPSVGVEAPIVGLSLRDDGSIEVPENTDETGWWRDGPEPGEIGPAVILGHVDSYVGPAVFFRLSELDAGDQIHIDREDGTTVTYVVEASERHNKDSFPTEAVYGATTRPTLRLITCGGAFDSRVGSYLDNLIVFASIEAPY